MLKNILRHTIFTKSLQKDKTLFPILIDCGANKGEFSNYINKEFGAICYGFEPDPMLYQSLKSKNDISFYQLAVGSSEGQVRLNLGEKHCSSIKYIESEKQDYIDVEMINLEKFCMNKCIESINLIKLDIEGAELDLLENLSSTFLSKVDQITVEFHDFLEKEDIPRIKNVIQRIRNEGFYVLRLSYFTYGDVLMINQARIKISNFEKFAFLIYKYMVGMTRFASRFI